MKSRKPDAESQKYIPKRSAQKETKKVQRRGNLLGGLGGTETKERDCEVRDIVEGKVGWIGRLGLMYIYTTMCEIGN